MNNPFEKRREKLTLLNTLRAAAQNDKPDPHKVLRGVTYFAECSLCGKQITSASLAENWYVCPDCGWHFPISARDRLHRLADEGTLREMEVPETPEDPLDFPGYREKLLALREKHGLTDAAVTAFGRIDGRGAVFAALDSRFLMGSMGAAVGEAVTRAVEAAQRESLPLIIFSASGGARMQEGIFSLMQMAKTSAAIARFSRQGGLYISYLTHPTTGGVSASFAGLGDITLAEPGALIGFAGPRVIEQTIRQKLPEGFQRAEFQEEHGFVDRIVPRGQMRRTLSLLLRMHEQRGNPVC